MFFSFSFELLSNSSSCFPCLGIYSTIVLSFSTAFDVSQRGVCDISGGSLVWVFHSQLKNRLESLSLSRRYQSAAFFQDLYLIIQL